MYAYLNHTVFEKVISNWTPVHAEESVIILQYCDEEIVKQFGMSEGIKAGDHMLLAARIKADRVTLFSEDSKSWVL